MENRLKRLAVDMAHLMSYQEKEYLRDYEREELRAEHSRISNEVIFGGHSVQKFLFYIEEYKTLNFEEYHKWIKE